MIKEHNWKKIYDNSDVEQCDDCPVQRRGDGSGGWQYRASPTSPEWAASDGRTAPDCSDGGAKWFAPPRQPSADDGTWVRGGYLAAPWTPDRDRATESLETELQELSGRIAADPPRFQEVRAELKRRRETRDEQPPPDTAAQQAERTRSYEQKLGENLALKVTMMEAEQAKLVVELEIAKATQRDAEERLALVVRHLSKREPMTRDAARELALRHIGDNPFGTPGYNIDWVIDAIVEASK
jgi:hypothetical protein